MVSVAGLGAHISWEEHQDNRTKLEKQRTISGPGTF